MNHTVAEANSFFRCKSRIPWFERSGRLDYTEALAKGSTQRFVQSLVGVLNGLRADWTELPVCRFIPSHRCGVPPRH